MAIFCAAFRINPNRLLWVALPIPVAVIKIRIREAVAQPAFKHLCGALEILLIAKIDRNSRARGATMCTEIVGAFLVAIDQIMGATALGRRNAKLPQLVTKLRIQLPIVDGKLNEIGRNNKSAELPAHCQSATSDARSPGTKLT